ncbi:MAG: hypothetical protein WAL50_10200 [Kineosporiaceae bacterium]
MRRRRAAALLMATVAVVALGAGTYIWSGEGCDGSTCSHLTPYALDTTMTLELPSARACVRVQADGRLSTQYRRLRWPGDHRRYTSAELSPGSLWVTVTTSCTETTEFAVQNLTVENRWTATPDGLTTFQIPDSDGAHPPLRVIVCDQGGARSGTFS